MTSTGRSRRSTRSSAACAARSPARCSTPATRRISRRPTRPSRRRRRSLSDLSAHFVVPFEASFDARAGFEYLAPTHARVRVRPEHLGVDGTVQSGVYPAIAEAIASTGTAVEVVPQGLIPSGLSNSTHVVGEARDGVLEAHARVRARGAGEWVWDVEIGPDGGVATAVATVTIAVRQKRV